jgi:hypothetical protein
MTFTLRVYAQQENEIVIDWNELAYQVAYEHDQFYSFIGIRSLTMTHLAIHDALNAIEAKYETYAYRGRDAHADPVAAVAQAAYEVLVQAYPQREDTLAFTLQKWLDRASTGKKTQAGIALGKQTAAAILKAREGDGHEKQGDYTPMTKPGDYQYTPGWDGWVLKPDFSYARPFCLDSVNQFRSPPSPKLTSSSYTQSFREVKAYGAQNSTLRTEDQTNYAHWWAEFAEHSWNRIGRITARSQALPLWETARMFALINMDIYDIYLASLESKYFYDTWRPYTAIRAAETDQNRHTEPDAGWQPEMLTPPWPEYPSAHAAVGSGGAEIMAHVYGRWDILFTMESTSALAQAKMRAYHNFRDAADDCADSRIMNGYHFRFATEEGKRQGEEIARYIFTNFLRPVLIRE